MAIKYHFTPGTPGEPTPRPGGPSGTPHRVVAKEGDRVVGKLDWKKDIQDVFVEKPFRRQGIATGMLNYARELSSQFEGVLPPEHSEHRTEEGDAWARALGDDVPELKPYKRQYNNIWNE